MAGGLGDWFSSGGFAFHMIPVAASTATVIIKIIKASNWDPRMSENIRMDVYENQTIRVANNLASLFFNMT